MPCYHPLKAFEVGVLPSGKADLKICGYEVDHVERLPNGTLVPSLYPDRGSLAVNCYRKFTEIPCGHCIGCRIMYSREWANRCLLESECVDSSYFLTITYNNDFVPRSHYVDQNTGEVFDSLTLKKRDLQLFFKRLRKAVVVRDGLEESSTAGVRYFCCGEYGSHTYRPHYHAIIFGLRLDDLKLYKRNFHGDCLYTSEFLQNCWSSKSSPLGFIVVAPCSWETCAYTARYVCKKAFGIDKAFYEAHGLEPEFTLMSRRPGIGRPWFDLHPDVKPNDVLHISTPAGGKSFRPPKYYQKLYEVEFPDEAAELKAIRQRIAEDARELKLEKTNLSYLELLQVEEDSLIKRIKSLKRGDCDA